MMSTRAIWGLLFLFLSGLLIAGCGEEVEQQSCEIVGQDEGSTTVVCPDGSEYVVDDGADGADGEDGQDGTGCTVSEDDDGNTVISCEDGTEGTVEDGEDGEDGQDGTSCWVEDNEDGTHELGCNDGTSVTISDGQDGQDGQDGEDGFDCDLIDDDGDYVLECEDGTTIALSDGSGSSCSVEDNGDGTATLNCDGSPSIDFNVVADGEKLEVFIADAETDDDGTVSAGAIVRNVGTDDRTDSFTVEFYEQEDEPTDSDDSNASDTIDGLDAGDNFYAAASYTTDETNDTDMWVGIVADGELVDTSYLEFDAICDGYWC